MQDIETYIKQVRNLGIEEAYKQRHRCTGRTVRNVLDLAMRMSRGEKIHLVYRNASGQRRMNCSEVQKRVCCILDQLGMQYVWNSKDNLSFPQSGGRMVIMPDTPMLQACRAEGWTEYVLHEC